MSCATRPENHCGKCNGAFGKTRFPYLLILRLVPLFPFFVVNVVPAFLGVSLRTYAVGTFFGIIPGTFVFASVAAASAAFSMRTRPSRFPMC